MIANAFNAPFLYYHAPASNGDKGPEAATWRRPSRRNRIKMRPLLTAILGASGRGMAIPLEQNLAQTYLTCDLCNYIMTQKADFRYLLGYNTVGSRNTRGTIIQGPHIQQYKVNGLGPLNDAYDHWTFKQPPAVVIKRPNFSGFDSDSPHVAYFLHMCMPYKNDGQVCCRTTPLFFVLFL